MVLSINGQSSTSVPNLPKIPSLANAIGITRRPVLAARFFPNDLPLRLSLGRGTAPILGVEEPNQIVASMDAKVKVVADAIDQVKKVADEIDSVITVANAIEDVKTAVGSPQAVSKVLEYLQSLDLIPNLHIATTDVFSPGTILWMLGEICCDDPASLDSDSKEHWNFDAAIPLSTGVACWTVILAIPREVAELRPNLQLEYKIIAQDDAGCSVEENQGKRILDCSSFHTTKIGKKEVYLVHATLLPM